MALIDKLSAIGDAIREKNGTTDLIPLADMPQAILDIVSGDGGIGESTEYKSITYNDDDTITLIGKDDSEHTMVCTYEGKKLVGVKYDGKAIRLGYKNDALNSVGTTAVDLSNAKTSGVSSVDHTVKFLANGSLYEIVSVKDGNLVNAPSGIPTSEIGTFTKWLKDGVKAEFPFVPREDVNIIALFQRVRDEMKLLEAGDIVYSYNNGTNSYDYIKVNDGLAIVGYSSCYIENVWRKMMVVISPTAEGCATKHEQGNTLTHTGTIQYDDVMYYYLTLFAYPNQIFNYEHAYDTELEVNDAELIARTTLDYYFIKI